ncbi:hypothetical protein OCU04_001070 [Sclerotinia nivalis]|uniref:Zn(2)-C6 fungal-type domain-containing protein n=1 Tax=Sclerotinia nivalis TaxID=352851 RepID=A0A9X0DPD3_9HELO|nr:hypothetical protein OCU04_001070 [Sclerotinia nivalis]
MIEKSTPPRTRAEWPNSVSPQRVRKRPQPQPSHTQRRHYSPSASPPASSHSHASSSSLSSRSRSSSFRHNPSYYIRLDTRPDKFSPAPNFDYFDFQAAVTTSPSSSIVGHAVGITNVGDAALNLAAQATLPDTSWMTSYSTGPPNTIPLSPEGPVSLEYSAYIGNNGGASLSLQTGAMSELSMSWNMVNSTTHLPGALDFEDICMSEANMGSYGSHGSMELASASAVSATSDTYVFPFGSPGGAGPLLDLALPYYVNQNMTVDQTIQRTEHLNTALPANSVFPFDNNSTSLWTSFDDIFPAEPTAPSAAPLLEAPDLLHRGRYIRLQNPGNSHDAHGNFFGENSNSGCVAYEPESSTIHSYEPEQPPLRSYAPEQASLPYEMSSPVVNDRLIAPGQSQSSNDVYQPEAPNTNWFDESDTSTSCSITLYTPSHGSPVSHHSPHPQGSQPPPSPSDVGHHDLGHHSHVFSAFSEPQKSKVTRGRVRPLTDKEKREARNVRQAGACWACHLSKIKCSPCSAGFPCEQCTRLSGKRRFCLLPCFNDPVEMLDKFLVPEKYIRMYTTENTKRFISKNADTWRTDKMVVRLSWGYRVPLKVTVVTLLLPESTSIFRYQHQTYINASGEPTFTRKRSPPLGIPLMSMEERQQEYARYIKEIVQHDLDEYAKVAYEPEESDLAKLLLKTVCQFYTAGKEANDEYGLLRQALEIHIACAILERSLILDEQSTCLVMGRLGEYFPADSSPRCASRQIKVAFFLSQQERIKEVLKEWGQMMWTSNRATANECKWATAFSVLLVLILVMDKTLGLSYCNAESRIKHGGKEAETERHEFQERVRLTQTNLFERCKEILHSKFKTRKGGKESFNPIRDGERAWRGKVINERIAGFVHDMKSVVRDNETQVRSCRPRVSKNPRDDPLSFSLKVDDPSSLSRKVDLKFDDPLSLSPKVDGSPYTDAARLACVFLDDFLEH